MLVYTSPKSLRCRTFDVQSQGRCSSMTRDRYAHDRNLHIAFQGMKSKWCEVCMKDAQLLCVLNNRPHRELTRHVPPCTYSKNNWRAKTHLLLPTQQNAVVNGKLNLDGDLIEIRGWVPACGKRFRGRAVLSCAGATTGVSERGETVIKL